MTPGYPPHHPGLHPTQSSMSRGTPGGASIATTPGSIATHADDDKGRGSYKCGRCGVPKKGHICPYQPKLKRNPNDPAPEMKCVSTQVEMDEFMTLRRLNIEIQGFPESYAAEPSDNCGTEVHPPPPPQQQHQQMTPSSQQQPHGPPPNGPPGSLVKPGMAPTSHLSGPPSSSNLPPPGAAAAMSMQHGRPTSLPSLSSMPSQPHPISAAPPVAAAAAAAATTKQPEQINSSAASVKTDAVAPAASEVHVKEKSTETGETDKSNDNKEEATKADSTTNVKAAESKSENDNKDVAATTEETSAENALKSDDNDANKKRSASEEKPGDETSESPVKKQKV